jgi:GT2 family glycosyltransferase
LHHRVSIIIVNWNGGKFLERCLFSLTQQTCIPSEIILVDNNSSDNSLDIVALFPSVKLLQSSTNIGFASGNNVAINRCSKQSEWIVLLNPDAYPEGTWLEELLNASILNPEFSVFGSKLVTADDPSIVDGIGDVYHLSGLVWRKGHGLTDTDAMDVAGEIFSPCAAAAMYRRSVIQELGGFDDDYFCYVEDVDLGFRIRLAGHRCLHVPRSVVRHVGSGTTGGQDSDFSVYHGHRNLVWTFVKNMPGILFWLLLPLHILLNIFTIILFACRGRFRLIWRSKQDALLGVPRMWRKRKLIQRTRIASVSSIWRVLDKHFLIHKTNKKEI